jgi:hypothetical protein
MDTIIDRVMNSTEIGVILDNQSLEEIRAKIGKYIATLSSAGKSDADEPIEYGLAYLRALHEAPDSRYTGC